MSNLAYINNSFNQNINTSKDVPMSINNENNIVSFTGTWNDDSNNSNKNVIIGTPDPDDYDEEEEIFTHQVRKFEVFPFKTDEDIKKMCNYFASVKDSLSKWRNILMFTIGCNIGLRAGDLLQLKWKHLIKDNNIVDTLYAIESKTKNTRKQTKIRTLSFNSECRQAIESYLKQTNQTLETVEKEDYIFKSRKGDGHILVRSANRILKQAAIAVGITYNVGTHSMRKTFGYTAYKITGNLEYVQKLFGHSNSNVTLRYIGIDEEIIRNIYNSINLNINQYVEDCLGEM